MQAAWGLRQARLLAKGVAELSMAGAVGQRTKDLKRLGKVDVDAPTAPPCTQVNGAGLGRFREEHRGAL